MTRLWTGCLLLFFTAVAADRAAGAPLPKDPAKGMPQLVVQVKSINGIMDDYDHLKERLKDLGDTPLDQLGPLVAAMFAGWEIAVDTTKPLGLFVVVQPEIEKSCPVLLIPVQQREAFLKMMQQFLPDLTEDEEKGTFHGSFKFIFGNNPVHFRLKHGYAYLSRDDGEAIADATKLPLPTDLLLKEETALIAARLYLEGLPEETKTAARDYLAKFGDDGRVGGPEMILMALLGASDVKDFTRRLRSLVDEAKWAALRLEFDRKTDELSLRFDLVPRRDTAFGKDIADFKPRPSKLAELLDGDTAAGFLLSHGNFGGLAIEPSAVSDILQDILTALDMEGSEEARGLLAKAVVNSIRVNEADVAAALKKGKETYTLVVGAKLNQPKLLAAAMFAYMQTLPKEKRGRLTFNAVKLDDGTMAHRLTLPDPDEKIARQFAKPEIYFFQKDDILYSAFGSGAVARLNECLKLKPRDGDQYRIEYNPAKLIDWLKHDIPEDRVETLKKLFPKDEKYRAIVGRVEGGSSLRITYTADAVPLIKLFWGAAR